MYRGDGEILEETSDDAEHPLTESKKWDHAVELIPGEKASNCKVYLLALTEIGRAHV